MDDDGARERDQEWLDPAPGQAPAQRPEGPRHHAKVGYSMILVAASLAVIGVLHLSIGEEVLYADQIQRAQTANYESCAESGFGEGCEKYMPFVTYERCVADLDLESPECRRYTTWVESEIFEGCRSARDSTSPECARYAGLY
ncbi:MAG: hypothetical protein OXU86_01820 [Thaumarchaeota archaeon]|nr:hypothetical protein [Nitrososphaerota archaeon]RNJ72641.1 MAG: hypothetical protein EB824_05775 [Thaumarchaeota archaeon S15]RNJ74082.1 MAG: hypothetical protein EB832_00645 [Thaumarchaeota archaeon S14]RNJ74333.1 MAG: hypothetical protein EB833_00855 [Thaumarchaeota archaeon S13]MDD9825504.1 hypothetical protein [Nitrososphaerota archaeon]